MAKMIVNVMIKKHLKKWNVTRAKFVGQALVKMDLRVAALIVSVYRPCMMTIQLKSQFQMFAVHASFAIIVIVFLKKNQK